MRYKIRLKCFVFFEHNLPGQCSWRRISVGAPDITKSRGIQPVSTWRMAVQCVHESPRDLETLILAFLSSPEASNKTRTTIINRCTLLPFVKSDMLKRSIAFLASENIFLSRSHGFRQTYIRYILSPIWHFSTMWTAPFRSCLRSFGANELEIGKVSSFFLLFPCYLLNKPRGRIMVWPQIVEEHKRYMQYVGILWFVS